MGSYQSGARPSDLSNPNAISSASIQQQQQQQQQYPSGDVLWDAENGNAGGPSGISASGSTGVGADSYETTFGWRVDFEAAAAYAAGPFLAILLLVLETRNDYMCVESVCSIGTMGLTEQTSRFHAWQSLLLSIPIAVLHFILHASKFLTWLLLIADIAIFGQLA